MKNTTLVIILTEMSKPEHPVHGPGLQVFHKHPRWESNTSHIVANVLLQCIVLLKIMFL